MINQIKTKRRRHFAVLCAVLTALYSTLILLTTTTASAASAVNIEEVMELAYACQKNSDKSLLSKAADTVVAKEDEWEAPSADKATDITNATFKTALKYTYIKNLADGVSKNNIRSDKTPVLAHYAKIAANIYKGFPTETSYNAAVAKLCKPEWSTKVDSLYPEPTGNATSNDITSAISAFTSAATSGAVTDAFNSTFGIDDWDPNAGVAGAALSTINNVANQVFFFISTLTMIFFLVQTGLDITYIIAEPIRPFISRGQSSGGGNNGATTAKFCIPLASSAVVEVCNGGMNGGGSGGGNNGALGSSNVFIRYIIARAPVLILGAVYLILVTMGYWQSLIGWVAGFVVQAFSWLFTLGA